MDAEGTVYVDYAFDIMQALEKADDASKDEFASDLREHLLAHSFLCLSNHFLIRCRTIPLSHRQIKIHHRR